MKNKEITIYELMGLVKNGNAPKKIKFSEDIYTYVPQGHNYKDNEGYSLFGNHIINIINYLAIKVEILPEENDEWEDIEEYDIGGPVGDIEISLDYLKNVKCTNVEALLAETINKLIKNQKYLKEKLESKDD